MNSFLGCCVYFSDWFLLRLFVCFICVFFFFLRFLLTLLLDWTRRAVVFFVLMLLPKIVLLLLFRALMAERILPHSACSINNNPKQSAHHLILYIFKYLVLVSATFWDIAGAYCCCCTVGSYSRLPHCRADGLSTCRTVELPRCRSSWILLISFHLASPLLVGYSACRVYRKLLVYQ